MILIFNDLHRLLELFLINKNKFLTNDEIIKYIWSENEISSSAFKSLINRLSKKIGKDVISNSFGMGYGIHNQIRKETQRS